MRHQVDKGVPQISIRDVAEAFQQFERISVGQQSLRRFGLFAGIFVDAVKQSRDRNLQHIGDLHEAAGADAVGSFLVFLYLLEGHADPLGESGLGKLRLDPVKNRGTQRFAGWVWPICFILVGLMLLSYREA